MASDSLPALYQSLLDPAAYPHPTESISVLETHISWVILTGRYAYKLKKPVDFGFVDFSTLARRQHFCEEEIRLNRRFAPDLYQCVVPITGTAERLRIEGGGDPVDFAVKMRQFDQRCLFDRLVADGRLGPRDVDVIADVTATFHLATASAHTNDRRGTAQAVRTATEETFSHLLQLASDDAEHRTITELADWHRQQIDRLAPLIEQRRRLGCVRECHGDLHLGNVVLIDGRPTPFDCIEFNPALRWIDVVSDVAFLAMDLEVKGARAFAYRFMNRYEAITGDYAGLRLWDYFRMYRAMVRAKVCRLTMAQRPNASRTPGLLAEYRAYLEFGGRLVAPRSPWLVITHGFSGSGKSFIAEALSEQLPSIWLRSDIERKRLCPTGATENRYAPAMTRQTYSRLCRLAATLIEAGLSVIVDATFLQRWQRQLIQDLADATSVPLVILDIQTPTIVLESRIRSRALHGNGPSEATVKVLHMQRSARQDFTEQERSRVLVVDGSDPDIDALTLRLRGWVSGQPPRHAGHGLAKDDTAAS